MPDFFQGNRNRVVRKNHASSLPGASNPMGEMETDYTATFINV
jgi:hypothetical protein